MVEVGVVVPEDGRDPERDLAEHVVRDGLLLLGGPPPFRSVGQGVEASRDGDVVFSSHGLALLVGGVRAARSGQLHWLNPTRQLPSGVDRGREAQLSPVHMMVMTGEPSSPLPMTARRVISLDPPSDGPSDNVANMPK